MFLKFQIVLLFAVVISSCGSRKMTSNSEEFQVENLKRIDLDDQEFEVTFEVRMPDSKIKLEYLYFENKKAPVLKSSEDLYSVKFSALKSNSEDRILSIDRSEESKNTLPQLPVKSPVEIKKSEALLSYSIGSEIMYKVLNFETN